MNVDEIARRLRVSSENLEEWFKESSNGEG
jgi:hypothetical protein